MIKIPHKVIILRHGETTNNADNCRVQTSATQLNINGHRQAYEVAEKLADLLIHQIITSKLDRAMMTGDIVASRIGIKDVIRHEVFNERDQGHLKGLIRSEIKEKHPEYWNIEKDVIDYTVRPVGGENLADLHARVDDAIVFINSLDKNTLIVSHGGFMRALLARLGNITDQEEINKIKIPNCSYFEIN